LKELANGTVGTFRVSSKTASFKDLPTLEKEMSILKPILNKECSRVY